MKKSLSLIFSLLCCTLSSIFVATPVTAQDISPDGTTDTTVDSDGNGNYNIRQGDRAGNNLFHSFDNFSVPTNGSAVFNNDLDVSNIFNRVTGGNISNIDGLIEAQGSANLFLINPAGIMFGNDARLDLGGSFFGTTADSILFEDGEFSATDLDNPPLLTVNAPIGLNFRDNPRGIVNSSFVESDGDFVGLEVEPGNNLSLVGGDINFDSGEATARGGRVELGGLNSAGTVTIESDGSLTFPDGVARANITFSNAADLDVMGEGGGDISVNANNIELSGGNFGASRLRAGILSSSTAVDAQAGNISLDATGTVDINDGSFLSNTTFGQGNAGNINLNAGNAISLNGGNIFAQVELFGEGDAGAIAISTADLFLLNGAQITAGVFGSGNAGNITITASGDITFQGIENSSSGFPSGILNNIASDNTGSAGDIEINTSSLNLIDGGAITSSVSGSGDEIKNAGNIEINASGTVNVSGFTNFGENSSRFSQINSTTGTGTVGNAGSININADSFTLNNGAFVASSTFGMGNTGNIDIDVDNAISLNNDTQIFSNIGLNAIAEAGVRNTVAINAGSLSIVEGSSIDTSTFGQGDAGNIAIAVDGDVSIAGFTVDTEGNPNISSNISSELGTNAVGSAGNIDITADSLTLDNRAFLSNSTFGEGDAGNVTVDVNNGVSLNNNAIIFNNVERNAVGNSGGIIIDAQSLALSNGSQIQTLVRGSTAENPAFGQGNAGDISIDVQEDINLTGFSVDSVGNRIVTQVNSDLNRNATGSAGNVNLRADSLTLNDRAFVSSSTFGQGNAGDVNIDVDNAVSLNSNAQIFSSVEPSATTEDGARSNVTINAGSLSIAAGSSIDTSTFGRGDAGNIAIAVDDTVTISGFAVDTEGNPRVFSNIASLLSTDAVGSAGNIRITAGSLTLDNRAFLSNSTLGEGNAGNLVIDVDNGVSLDNDAFIVNNVERNAVGNSGGIIIDAQSLAISNGSQIQTLVRGSTASNPAFGQGNAGDISINVQENVSLTGFFLNNEGNRSFSQVNSDLGLNAVGSAGNINVSANSLTLDDGASISNSTFGEGNAGNVTVDVNNGVSLNNNAIIFNNVERNAVGNSGGITINAQSLALDSGSQIQTLVRGSTAENPAFGQGNAGDISINVQGEVDLTGFSLDGEDNRLFSQVNSDLNRNAIGSAGNVNISADFLTLNDGAFVSSSTFGLGNAGDVNIDVDNAVTLNSNAQIFSNVGSNAIVAEGFRSTVAINAGSLSLTDRSSIDTSTFGQGDAGEIALDIANDTELTNSNIFSEVGSRTITDAVGNAGNIEIETVSITINNRAFISNSTFGVGNAGLIDLKARDSVVLDDGSIIFNTVEAGGIGNSLGISIEAQSLSISGGSQIQTLVRDANDIAAAGQGNAGDITIDVGGDANLSGFFTDEATNSIFSSAIFSDNFGGTGRAGSIALTADRLSLDDGGIISASNRFGTGGNIDLSIDETITLQNNSLISAQAFGDANGGNLSIDTNFIVAFPNANSDIIANAEQGEGGVITIDAESLLGIEEGTLSDLTNDINASSEDSTLDGNIEINTSDLNSLQRVTELPSNTVEPDRSVAQACAYNPDTGVANSLIVRGRGGVPGVSTNPLSSELITVDDSLASNSQSGYTIATGQGDITPARGAVKTKDGRIVLTASTIDAARIPQGSGNCG